MSAQATVEMIAGNETAGGFESKKVVIKFEHKACIAQRMLSIADYDTSHNPNTADAPRPLDPAEPIVKHSTRLPAKP